MPTSPLDAIFAISSRPPQPVEHETDATKSQENLLIAVWFGKGLAKKKSASV
ncbi:MAG: hypothetical protein HQL91_04005 [Magnetococcales bacterium]|nr:hypothetical protein [Magnetococcales bacterium]